MAKKDDKDKGSTSIVDEIELQLEEALSRRKDEVERELEERIKREREEARKRIDEINKELVEEKDALSNFKTLLNEFEASKINLKKQIKEHINKAIQFQTDIETLTGQTLGELKKVRELNLKYEELQQDTGQEVTDLKNKLEEKFGIVAEVPETEWDESEINLEQELVKLKKIKELLNNKEPNDLESNHEVFEETPVEESQEVVPEEESEKPEEKPVEETMEEEQPVVEVTEDQVDGPKEEEEEPKEETEEESQPEEGEETMEEAVPEVPESEYQQPAEEETGTPVQEEGEVTEEAKEEAAEETVEEKGEKTFQTTFEKLEGFRKGTRDENDGEVSYFEYNERIVLDGECLVATLNNSFEEAKKMYIKLSQTESPKDQFFVKQEIIKQQETLRKVMLRSIRLCEQENCSLPDFTKEILNLDALKTILEKVSMENWSNQDDFAAFDNYSKELKDAFYTRITPPADYLESIMKQLEI